MYTAHIAGSAVCVRLARSAACCSARKAALPRATHCSPLRVRRAGHYASS